MEKPMDISYFEHIPSEKKYFPSRNSVLQWNSTVNWWAFTMPLIPALKDAIANDIRYVHLLKQSKDGQCFASCVWENPWI